jgi:hypothetical protein
MILQLPHLVIEITLGTRYILFVRAIHFLVVIVAASSDCDPPGVLLLPLLAALRTFFSSSIDGFGRHSPTGISDHFPIT